jgi:hypothetical protein
VLLVQLVRQVLKDLLEIQDQLVLLVLQVQREPLEILEQLVPLVQQGLMLRRFLVF